MSKAEIAELRRAEEMVERFSAEADLLCRELVGRYACDFVHLGELPFGTWCALPRDWQSAGQVSVTIRSGKPPKDHRGAVGVRLDTLRWIAAEER